MNTVLFLNATIGYSENLFSSFFLVALIKPIKTFSVHVNLKRNYRLIHLARKYLIYRAVLGQSEFLYNPDPCNAHYGVLLLLKCGVPHAGIFCAKYMFLGI